MSEREYDIDPDNFTSDADTSVASPRFNNVKKSSTNNFAPIERDSSHQTLYELVDMPKSRPSIRSLPTVSKYSCNGAPLKPFNSVQFSQSQLSISTDCLSTSKFKIHRHGNRVPIRISSLRRETKTAQTLSMVVGGFVVCWLPFFVCYLLMPFVPTNTISEGLMSTFTWLGWCNSFLNPIIYCAGSPDFRQAFYRLTLRRCFKSARKPPYGNSTMNKQ